jgi:hypothetical protein
MGVNSRHLKIKNLGLREVKLHVNENTARKWEQPWQELTLT